MVQVEEVSLRPRVTDAGKIVVDLQTALYSHPNIRAPGISFEIKTALDKAVAISSDVGICEIADLVIDDGTRRALTENDDATISITATYSEGDEIKTVVHDLRVNVADQVRELLSINNAKRQREEARRQAALDEEKKRIAEAEKQRRAREAYEALDPEKKRQVKAAIVKSGDTILHATSFQIDPFNTLREYADHPNTLDIILEIAARMPDRLIAAVAVFKDVAWAGRAMAIAANEAPETAISAVVGSFIDMPWALDVLTIAANRHPKVVIDALPVYCHTDWHKDLIFHIAETSPNAIFETVLVWEFYPWAREVAMFAASKAPGFVVHNYPLYQHQPWAQEVYEQITSPGRDCSPEYAEVQRLLKAKINASARYIIDHYPQDKSANFVFLYEHRHHYHTKVVMLDIASKRPDACIDAIPMYKHAPWARDVMTCAAERLPREAIAAIKSYVEMPWADSVLITAATQNAAAASLAVQYIPDYAAKPWADVIAFAIARAHPDAILQHIDFIEYQVWAEDALIEASRKDPMRTMPILQNYSHQPWADSLKKKLPKLEQDRQRALTKKKNDMVLSEQGEKLSPDKFIEWLMSPQCTLHLDDSELRRVVEEVERRYPGTAIYTYHFYQRKSWCDDILINALQKDPTKFVNIRWESISVSHPRILDFYKKHRDRISFNQRAVIACFSKSDCESFFVFLCRGNPRYAIKLLVHCKPPALRNKLMNECLSASAEDAEKNDVLRLKSEVEKDLERQLAEIVQRAAEEDAEKKKERVIEIIKVVATYTGIALSVVAGGALAIGALILLVKVVIAIVTFVFEVVLPTAAVIVGIIALMAHLYDDK